MGDVGDKVATRFFDALGFGEIAEDGDGASIGEGSGGYVEGAAGNDGSGAGGANFFGGGGRFDGGEKIGIANGFDDGSVETRVLRNEAIHGLIGPLHEAVGADGDDRVLHAVQEGFELALAGAHGGEAAFDLSGSLVDGGGDAANFIERRIFDAGLEFSALDADGYIDDALEASRGPDGSGGGDEQSDEQSNCRAPNQTSTDFRLNRFDIREGIGETDGASGNRSGDIEEGNADGGAAALVLTRPSSQGGDEFLASGVVLHGRGIGFGIGENFSGGVDDGGAGSGSETLLRCDFRERSMIDFDTMGEEESLLREIAFDLGAQRSFPCATDHDVEGGSGSGDDDEENGKELEEDAVLHVLLVCGSGN